MRVPCDGLREYAHLLQTVLDILAPSTFYCRIYNMIDPPITAVLHSAAAAAGRGEVWKQRRRRWRMAAAVTTAAAANTGRGNKHRRDRAPAAASGLMAPADTLRAALPVRRVLSGCHE